MENQQDIGKQLEELIKRQPELRYLEDIDSSALKKILQDTTQTLENQQQKHYQFVSKSNEVTSFYLIQNEEEMADMKNKLKFNPLFSYNVYRDEELIFGYKELDISIYFQAATLCPYVQISYTDKEDNADNIYEMLDKIFLRGYCTDVQTFTEKIQEQYNFKPFGQLMRTFKQNNDADNEYEVYLADFLTPGFSEYNERLQVFLLFFIDGASYIEQTEY